MVVGCSYPLGDGEAVGSNLGDSKYLVIVPMTNKIKSLVFYKHTSGLVVVGYCCPLVVEVRSRDQILVFILFLFFLLFYARHVKFEY